MGRGAGDGVLRRHGVERAGRRDARSGGSFHYLREAFGLAKFGRLMGFLFVWQFVLSGPLEIASGYIGFSDYSHYIWKTMTSTDVIVLVTVIGIVNIALLYRRITSIAKLTIT